MCPDPKPDAPSKMIVNEWPNVPVGNPANYDPFRYACPHYPLGRHKLYTGGNVMFETDYQPYLSYTLPNWYLLDLSPP